MIIASATRCHFFALLLLRKQKLKPQGDPRLFSYLFINLKASSTQVLEVTIEFKSYNKAAVIFFAIVYPSWKKNGRQL